MTKKQKNSKNKVSVPKRLDGKSLWKRFSRIRTVIINSYVPVWNENKCFDTFPSGTQLYDFLKLIMQKLALKNKDNELGVVVTADDVDDEDSEDGIASTPEDNRVTTSVTEGYSTPITNRSPLVMMLNTPGAIEPDENDAMVSMPPEWLVFVKFGPPADSNCDHIWLTEIVDDSKSNKNSSRKKQRAAKLERDDEARAAQRTETRGVDTNKKQQKNSEPEVIALLHLNELLEADQEANYYKELFTHFPHRQEELKDDYEAFLMEKIEATKKRRQERK